MEKRRNILRRSIWTGIRRLFHKNSITSPVKPKTRLMVQVPRYVLIEDQALADHYFRRLQQTIYRQVCRLRSREDAALLQNYPIFWESGRIHPGRAYFYLKPRNELGWLFERSGLGWVISRSEKIVGQDLFLRQSEPWDITALYEPLSREGYCRISSQQTDGDLIGFAVYEKLILDEIGSEYDERVPSIAPRGHNDPGISL